MASRYWGPLDSVWTNVANWYNDEAHTIPSGVTPQPADNVWLLANSGSLTIDANPTIVSLYLGNATPNYYSGTLDFAGHILTITSTFGGLSAVYTAVGFVLTCGTILCDTVNNNITVRYPTVGTISDLFKLTLKNTTANRDVIIYGANPTITTLEYSVASTARVDLETGGGTGITIRAISGADSSKSGLVGTAAAYPIRLACDFDRREFLFVSGYFEFGIDTDINIYLPSALNTALVSAGKFVNKTASDITAYFHTPDGQGNLRMTTLTIATESTGHMTLDFDDANIQPYTTTITQNLLTLTTSKISTGEPRINFGSTYTSTFFIYTSADFRNIGTMSAGSYNITLALGGQASSNFFIPDADVLFPVKFKIYDPGAVTDQAVYFLMGGTKLHITGPFTVASQNGNNITCHMPGSAEITIDEQLSVAGTATKTAALLGDNTETVWLLTDLLVKGAYGAPAANTKFYPGTNSVVTISGAGQSCFIETAEYNQASGELIINATRASTFNFYVAYSTVQFDTVRWQLNQTAGAPAAQDIYYCGQDLDFQYFEILNELTGIFKVKLQNSRILSCDELLINCDTGDPCATPITADNIVQIFASSGTAKIRNTAASYPSFTKFIDIDHDEGGGIFADDGTCFDGGGNSGITFTQTTGSIAICPDDEASFIACYYGTLPEQQQFIIKNIGIDSLPEPTVTNKPAWLSVNFSKEGTGWLMNIWPNDTTIAAGVHNETITINVAGARRSPHDFAIEYELTYCIIPYPTPSPKTFTIIHKTTYPGPATISVDNPSAGHTAVMDTPISLLNMPDWLDADINPLGETGDHQAVEFTVNATGLALPTGIYHAYIEITADNADENGVLHIILDVSEILVDTEPAAMTFTIREGGSLPDPQALNISNSGVATLTGVTVVDDAAWLTSTLIGSGDGNNQYATIELNAAAQALAGGTYYATITVDSAVANNTPYTVPVTLVVVPPVLFLLNPESIEFTPDKDWNIPAAQTVQVIGNNQGPFAAPVAVTGAPAWLSVTINAINPLLQIITLTPLEIPVDPLDFSATLTITGSYSAELPVSMTLPAFFRRADCQMDFIPRIIGTIIDECDVPPPPPLAPVSAPIIPTLPAPTYPNNITMVGPPCIDCVAWVEYDQQDEYGFGKAHFYIVCDDHGCLEVERELLKGVYSEFDHVPGGAVGGNDNHVITAIEIDECGHVCGIWFEDDDMSSSE